MLDDGHPSGYLPQRTAHSTSDCEDWSSLVPPDKTQLFHSCGNDKKNSKPIDTAVLVSSFSLLNCEAQHPCLINLQVYICIETTWGTGQFTSDRLIMCTEGLCKDPPHDI